MLRAGKAEFLSRVLHRGAFEVTTTVFMGARDTVFMGKGLNYSMCKQVIFFELGSNLLIIIYLTAEQKDA